MRFPGFRKRGAADVAPPQASPPDVRVPEVNGDNAWGDAAEDAAEFAELSWWSRAESVIPGGASTGSKRAASLFGGDVDGAPTHFVTANGCTIAAPDGTTYLDCTMALGAVALGYAEEHVTRNVLAAAAGGNVAGLSHTLEVEVAERLCDMIPCAERVRFLKTGAEAVAASVRIARTATGRARVIACGYFGWLDWCSDAAGVPLGARADVTMVPFADEPALERAAAEAGGELAAIVLEPVVERLPPESWIRRARALCDSAGAALVFDEIKTGFRLRTGGYQEHSGVTPDLAAFGKAMGNGYPIAAVVGRAGVMDAAERTWISSTLASEATALAAASAVLDAYEATDVCGTLERIGGEMRDAVARAAAASGIDGVSIEGLAPMWLTRFSDLPTERLFLRHAAGHGVLFKRGAYNFAALPHAEVLAEIEAGASEAFVAVMEEREG